MIYIGQFDDTEYYPEELAADVIDAFKKFGLTVQKEEKVIEEISDSPKILRRRTLVYNSDGTPKFDNNNEPVIENIVVGAETSSDWKSSGFDHKIAQREDGSYIQMRKYQRIEYYVDFTDSLSDFVKFASENWIDVRWDFDAPSILFKETTWKHK